MGLAIICKAKKYVDNKSLIQLYSSFILPYLICYVQYCDMHSDPIHKLATKKNSKNNDAYFRNVVLGRFDSKNPRTF